MLKKDCRYECKVCEKFYSSSNSLWNHNKKFHSENNTKKSTSGQPKATSGQLYKIKKYNCKYCNKEYLIKQSKWKHEKKCIFISQNNEISQIKKDIELLKNNSQIINNTNNGVINNTQQNIIINQIGTETVNSLSIKDILKILRDGNNSPITCIEKINFNKKLPQNHSFCTTTLEGDHFTKINHKTQKPEKINKKDFINEILLSSIKFMDNISLLIEFDEDFRDKIPLEEQVKIKEILDNRSKFYESKNKRAFFQCINDMSYNFKDLILNTWKLIQPIEYYNSDSDESGEQLIDPNFKHYSDSDSD